jgi:hypothetical protein
MSLLDRQQDYSFSRYFDMGIEASDLAREFGYDLTRKNLQLPQFPGELDRLVELHDRLEEVLPYVPLTSHAELRIEYPLKVSNWLQGNLDYLFQLKNPAT